MVSSEGQYDFNACLRSWRRLRNNLVFEPLLRRIPGPEWRELKAHLGDLRTLESDFAHGLVYGLDENYAALVAALDGLPYSPQECADLLLHRHLVSSEARALSEYCQSVRSRYTASEMAWRGSLVMRDLEFSRSDAARFLSEWKESYLSRSGFDSLLSIGPTALDKLFGRLNVETRHNLIPTGYSLYLPPWKSHLVIADAIDRFILEMARNPAAVFKLTGREFEKVLRRIFEGYGYEVQLTATTRDGGVDLVCLARLGSVPIKVAIEAKRYRPDRPISVSLVRQFVGANKQWMANKLVYVTTSRYTKPAWDFFREPTVSSLLELKALPDIIKWANDFSERQYLQDGI